MFLFCLTTWMLLTVHSFQEKIKKKKIHVHKILTEEKLLKQSCLSVK